MAYLPFPSGTLLTYAGSTAPDGWLLCDGSAISRTTYARLFAAISTTYGTGDGALTFNLPDLRGVYPRGAGINGTANYGTVSGHTPNGGSIGSKGGQKTAKNGLAVSGGTASLTAGSASITAGGASLTGTTTFASNSHNHYEGDLKAAIGATGSNADAIGYQASPPSGRGPSQVGSYTLFSTGSTSATRDFNHHTPVYGTTNTNNQGASVGISYTAQALSHTDPTINSTAASINTGDSETTPAFLAVNYIIKL
jgi:microcystin-dependent protein